MIIIVTKNMTRESGLMLMPWLVDNNWKLLLPIALTSLSLTNNNGSGVH